jgi:hypothetical protein
MLNASNVAQSFVADVATVEKSQRRAFDTSVVSPITQSNVHDTPQQAGRTNGRHTLVSSTAQKSTANFSMPRTSARSSSSTRREGAAAPSPKGVFFRKTAANFGSVAVGSLTRVKIELCNATEAEQLVFLGDPSLPFVLLHNEVRLRPRSFVRVPVRFLPVQSREYFAELMAQTANGEHHACIKLSGAAL